MNRFPRYPRRPHTSGLARIRINGRDYYLGKFGSPESHEEYRRLMVEFASGTVPSSKKHRDHRTTVGELILLWISDNEALVTPKEVVAVRHAVQPLTRLFGSLPAEDFTAARLDEVRTAMISASWMTTDERADRVKRGKPIGWARSHTTHQVARILRVFRWAESRGHVPRGTWDHLRSLGPIPRNAKVRTTPKRRPVDFDLQVVPCLKHMPPQVAAMVQVQYYAGMRPGEVVTMKRNEIDMTSIENVWLYRPTHHKTDYRGDVLVKVIGPKGQTAMAPWLMAAEPDGYVFPPIRNRYARGRYDVEGYGRAIARACERAGVVPWCLYDLRRAAANRAESAGNISDASAYLGHKNIETTKIYLTRQNLDKAAEIARKIG